MALMEFFFLGVLVLLAVNGEMFEAWDVLPVTNARGGEAGAAETVVSLRFDLLVGLLAGSRGRRKLADGGVVVVFHLPELGRLACTMGQSNLFHSHLHHVLPSVVVRSGTCDNNSTMEVNFETSNPESFSALFTIPGKTADWFYVDHKLGDEYVVYAKSSKHVKARLACTTGLPTNQQQTGERRLADATPTDFTGVTLRLAVAANINYSVAAGNTLPSVANRIAATMSRVNGIYLGELGIYFQLVANSSLLFCADGDTLYCESMLPNTDSSRVLLYAGSFMAARGVPASKYDIGHVFTTSGDGRAGVGVLCQTYKAQGTTGLANPVGDRFDVDYVAHELGHQLGGEHSFRDCDDSGNEVASAAVEPGSGSTIMSYAGICGVNNLQANSDPYFDPLNLAVMRAYVLHQVNSIAGCGIKTVMANNAELTVTFPPLPLANCMLPLGNYFLLQGVASSRSSSGEEEGKLFYEWDQVNAGLESYADLTIGRFRSWKPRPKVPIRFFPNLYMLTNQLLNVDPYRKFERLPSTAGEAMRFRFVARTRFASNASFSEDLPSNAVLGDFAYRDLDVSFVSTLEPLKFSPATRMELLDLVVAGRMMNFTWTGLHPSDEVEILIAINSMPSTVTPAQDFNSEVHLVDLDWVSVLVARNNGSATARVPILGRGGVGQLQVNYLLRTTNLCTPFDYVAKGKLQE
ncbi:hypothetical protein BASA81_003865 [Batrachochytrium salamandrivorans]|nr:hypothetical protein BASA81_003865 [Batrachochytrium salamandrivorans]